MVFEISERKVTKYLLSNRTKSGFFLQFGYSAGEWTRLRDDILRMTENFPLMFERDNAFGRKYAVSGDIRAPNGRMIGLTTIWMMEPGEPEKVKFLTAYPS